MSTELHDALAQAADAGRARFDTRDAAEVISPATRRVSRHRTSVRVGTGLASVVVIGALLWGVDLAGGQRVQTVNPAQPSMVPGEIVDAEALLDTATARTRTETLEGTNKGTAALRCEAGDRNPHLDDSGAQGVSGVDCDAVWVDPTVRLALGNDNYISNDDEAGTVTYKWDVVNEGDVAVRIDAAGVIPVLVSPADGDVQGPSIYNESLAVADAWTDEDTKPSVLSSNETLQVLRPGEHVTGVTVWTVGEGSLIQPDAVTRALEGSEFAIDLHVRVAPSGEPTGTELLVDIADSFSYSMTGSDTAVWDVNDLAAIAEPRAKDETRDDAVAGMVCHHNPDDEDGPHDPRTYRGIAADDSTVATMSVAMDCDPVWFVGGPITALTDTSVASSGESVTVNSIIRNNDYRGLAIDEESVFAWFESESYGKTDEFDGYEHTMLGTSMWEEDGTVIALLETAATPTTIEPTGAFTLNFTESDTRTGSPLATLTGSGDPYSLSVWARIHEDNPAGNTTYVIHLGKTESFGNAN